MIVITDRPGQLCNRLWGIAPFVAFSLKYNIKLYVPYFDHYSGYFENLKRYDTISINVLKKEFVYRGFKRMIRTHDLEKIHSSFVVCDKPFEDYNELRKQLKQSDKKIFLPSWMQPFDTDLIREYKREIERLFTPKTSARNYVHQVLADHVSPGETLVGVHLRKADYKEFRGGSYFYPDATYREKMLGIRDQLRENGKKAVFLLCSDEKTDASHFTGLNTLTLEKANAINDLYALSRCNYIMGPPSTFSMWASFYGDVPLRFIHSAEQPVQLTDFSAIVAQNLFENGQRFEHSAE